MFLSLSQLCFLAASLPLSLSLDITLPDSTPIVFQSTQITLRRMPGDPKHFNLGAYWTKGEITTDLPDGPSEVPIYQVVTNFTQDQNVTITFNYTVNTDVEDHIMKAWVDGLHHPPTYSPWFAVVGSSTTDIGSGVGIASSLASPSAWISQSTASVATEEATPAGTLAQTKTASRTGAIVGGVLGSLAFLSIISGLVLLVQRRRQRARNSAPSRAFWKYLDEKRPSRSEPLQYPSPTYSPGVQARPLSSLREDYYHRTK
ncbi:hypothetical protein F5146DRAFT_53139 [Armillaria mellea]|nr:hypothetical protein F5146DRAFT_53139 [Armillaria mellea]